MPRKNAMVLVAVAAGATRASLGTVAMTSGEQGSPIRSMGRFSMGATENSGVLRLPRRKLRALRSVLLVCFGAGVGRFGPS